MARRDGPPLGQTVVERLATVHGWFEVGVCDESVDGRITLSGAVWLSAEVMSLKQALHHVMGRAHSTHRAFDQHQRFVVIAHRKSRRRWRRGRGAPAYRPRGHPTPRGICQDVKTMLHRADWAT